MSGTEILWGATTLGEAFSAASAVGGVVGAAGAISSGQQQAALNKYNAQVAEQTALATQAQAAEEDKKQRIRASSVLSDMRAATAANGLGLEGSPLELMAYTAATAERDAINIRNSGSVSAAQARSQAAADRLSATAARTGSYYTAGSSLLTGVSRLSRIVGTDA